RRLLAGLKDRGLKICLWINPYISELSSLFAEGKEKGYFARRADGSIYQVDYWQPGVAFVDFTNPQACAWYQAKLRELLDMGVDTFKTDFGESIPADARFSDGETGETVHNLYALLYNRTVFELLEETRGPGDALVFARSATACAQRYPVHWGGDCAASYDSMAAQLRGGLSLLLSGVAYWSHDIGGFFGTPTPDLFKRWIAFGLLSSHSRLHGESSYRVPWFFDEESVAVLRSFTELKLRLLPYLYGFARVAAELGHPLMRPMLFEFPQDPVCPYLDRQYMLGEHLLVAPVFNDRGVACYYLPEGRWTDFFTDELKEGGRWYWEDVDYFKVPLLVRENAIVPQMGKGAKPAESLLEGLTVGIYSLSGSARFTLFDEGQTVTITCTRAENRIRVSTSEPLQGLTLLLKGIEFFSSVHGAASAAVQNGQLVIEGVSPEVDVLLS
ncbi:MAG: alpha-xylosidase, partial [Spirochaetota bacterium]